VNLATAFVAQAKRQSTRPFIVEPDRTVTWAEALRAVARVAALLEAQGVGADDRVLLSAGNSRMFVYLWFGLNWLGASTVPLHGQAPSAAIADVVGDADITYAVGDRVGGARVAEANAVKPSNLLVFDAVHALDEALADQSASDRPRETHGWDESNLMYTSGTTGPPKGVCLSNTALLAGGRQLAQMVGLTQEDRLLLCLPLFHANPQVYGLMTALAVGSSVAIVPRFRPSELIDQAHALQATGFTYVGTVLARIANETPRRDHGLRLCIGGGAPPWAWQTIEDEFGIDVHELYGMTETGGWVTANRAGNRRRGSCGQVRPDVELAVLDSHDMAVPSGEVGEICVRPRAPDTLFSGYHSRPELTVARWRNLWFHTGDLGHLSPDGFLFFDGRTDDMIRRAGENILPAAVEEVLASHAAVAEVAVVAVPHPELGEEVKAVIVARGELDPEELLRVCIERLPKFAWPRYLEMRSSLPRTQTEKIVRAGLQLVTAETIDLEPVYRRLASAEL
jgi:acyl-CoA synthetase (AMP-forming)/AMP-acid ligase II